MSDFTMSADRGALFSLSGPHSLYYLDNAEKWHVVRDVPSLFLVEPMRIRDDLLADGLITEKEYRAMSWSSPAATRRLFVDILPRRGETSFDRFVSILKRRSELQFVARKMMRAVYRFGSSHRNFFADGE